MVGTVTSAGPEPRTARALPFAPALDGLRAIAVIAVLLYHGGVDWMPGGFLGVDLFFCLSGYLITSLLLAELRGTGRIDLKAFWLRRARRLLPAAFLVIAVSVAAAAILVPGDLAQTRGDAVASFFYVDNWHQLLVGQSYFAAFERPSLLRSTCGRCRSRSSSTSSGRWPSASAWPGSARSGPRSPRSAPRCSPPR